MEAEKEKNPETKVTSLKVKSAVIGDDGEAGIQDLKQKIDALTTVVKSSTLGEPNQSRAMVEPPLKR